MRRLAAACLPPCGSFAHSRALSLARSARTRRARSLRFALLHHGSGVHEVSPVAELSGIFENRSPRAPPLAPRAACRSAVAHHTTRFCRLGRLRRATPALRSGAIHLVATDHDETVLAYLGTAPDPQAQVQSSDAVLVLLNWADTAIDVRIPDTAALRVIGADGSAVDLLSGAKLAMARDGDRLAARVHLPARGALVLARRSSRIP